MPAVSPRKFAARPGARPAEQADHRIQFLPAALEIGAGYGEVGSVGSGGRQQQNSILAIPEFVLRNWILLHPDGRRGLNKRLGRGSWRIGQRRRSQKNLGL